MAKFFWGASSSAHQAEGGNRNDWTEWETKNAKFLVNAAKNHTPAGGWPSYIIRNYPNPLQEENYISGRASDHYNRFEEDFEIAKKLGHNAHRFSIEWSRIEPDEGVFDEKEVAHYRNAVKALRKRNIEPFVTLWHFTLPVWLAEKGGVLNKNFPVYFKRYVQKIVSSLKNDVNFWITVNEPEIYSLNSYVRGIWPPQKKKIFYFYTALGKIIKSHLLAFRVIKEISPPAQVGASLNLNYFESAGGAINNFLKKAADKIWNFYFLNRAGEGLDFIGLNYYFHNRINYGFGKNKNVSVSDLGYEIYPEGIYHVLCSLKKYRKSVYVTENGVADLKDAYREKFIKDHIGWIKKAIDEGIDARGYFHWSLTDNFEWDKGFWPRFGLVEIDYRTMERKIRPSAFAYKKIMEWSGLLTNNNGAKQ
jgi:beta-glucosidase